MRSLPLRRDLGLQLLFLSLLFVGLVVGGTLLFQRLAGQRLEADVKAADLALARAVAQESNLTMENALEAVRQLATYPAVVQADEAGMAALFRTLMSVRNDVNLVYRLDEEGTMLYHYPEGPGSTLGVDFSYRGYFQAARETRNPLVSKGRISPTTEQAVATAVMPLWSREGNFQGVVATNLKLVTLSRALSGIAREYHDESFQIVIVDAAGQIIASPTPADLLEEGGGIPGTVFVALEQKQAGNMIATPGGGAETLYSYVPIYSVGWGVVVSRPTAVAFATPTLFRRGALLAIAIFLLGGFLFWLGQSRYFINPLERLTAFSQSIGQNRTFTAAEQQALARVARRPDQIGHLTRSMQRMHHSIEARLTELATLLQTGAAVVSTLDLQTVLDRILEQVEQLLGVEMCAIFALDEADGTFRIQASRGLAPWYAHHTAVDPGEPDSVTMRAIHSGEAIQISDTETNPSFRARRVKARAAGYRSVLAVPLNTQHAPPSALLVFRPDAHVFSEREITLLTSFANQAAMAIENATLYAHSDMRLEEQTRRLEALIQSMQDGLILEDLQGRVLYANRRSENFTGLSAEAVRGNSVERLMDGLLSRARDPESAASAIAAAVGGRGTRQAEFALESEEGLCYLRLTLFDVTDANDMPIGRGRIIQDITQRHQIDRMKSALISTVSHELRTPLAAIKGYASTLLADDVQWDVQSQHEFLEIISSESDHLSNVVNDLLDMSRIESGSLDVSRQACELEDLIDEAAQYAHPRPDGRLQISLPSRLPSLYVDPRRIVAVLRNLLENAAKYSEGDSPITVRAVCENGHVVVRVEDEGPGIPPDHGHRIFDSFYRVESGLTRTKAGAGLGLAISQGFVRAHGGEIWVEPRNQGACIAFSLPLEVRD
jgi:PAS domain S-box-containing protein